MPDPCAGREPARRALVQVSARGYDPAVAWMTAIGAVHVLRAVRLAGSDADRLAARFGVREDATFEDRIPVTLMIDLWEAAIAESGRRDLAPLAATRAEPDERSLVGFVVANQPRLGDGVDLLHRYFPTVSDAYRWQVIDDRHHTTLRAEPVGPIDRLGWRCYLEFEATDIVGFAARITGGKVRPVAASFVHAEPDATSVHRLTEALGVAPAFRARATELVFSRAARAAVVPAARPSLCAMLVERLDGLLEAIERGTSTTARARTAIAAQLRAERASVDELARSLGLSRRSLERALAAEQTSPAALFDEERRTRALAWLPTLPISVIAERLGYSDGRAFARAFRRWTGASPREYTAQQTLCDNNGTVSAPR